MATVQDMVNGSIYGGLFQQGLKAACYPLAMGGAQKALVPTSPPVILADPEAASTILTMPTESESKGVIFIVFNTADAAENVAIRDSAGAVAVVTVSQNEGALLYCDGTIWRGFVGADT